MAEYTLDIPEWAPTGSYSVYLQLDPTTAIGSHAIRVEDFMPDRMKVDLSLLIQGEEKKLARPGDELQFKVEATTLFGPPAAGREAKALVRLLPTGVFLPAWPKYTFGDQEEKVGTREIPLGSKSTDQEGLVSWGLELPATEAYHGWLRAEAEVEVTELGGGRAIGGRRSVLVSPVSHLIGLRRDAATGEDGRSSDYGEPGDPIPFQVILVDLDGQAINTSTAVATVFRRKWRTVLRKDRQGRYRYMSEYDEETVEARDLDLAASENRVDFTVDRHGSYRLLVEDPENGARSSILFYVYGWGYAPWAMSAPEKITIRLDREEYAVGDVLKAEIEAPFPGLMLLTVERDEVFLKRWVRLDSNSAVVEIPVDKSVQPNAYVVATLLRPLDSVEVHAPARAFGAAPLVLSREPARLAVEIQAPETIRPRGPLSVRYRVPNASEETAITLAAVDEGILQITGFATPSPLDFYFQRRRLSVESFDVWSLLLPEFERVLAGSKPGGDAAVLRKNLNPISVRRVKPVALWSGVMEASRDWRTFEFDVPEFNGALRVMAVAAGGEKFGNTEHLLRVRDPIVLSPNLPRFLAPGDKIEIPVQVYNGLTEESGDTVSIQVSANLAGPVAMGPGGTLQESRVAGGKERVLVFESEAADSVGKATFTFVGQGEGRNERVQVSTDLSVRPPRPLEVRVQGGTVREGQPATGILATDLYPETARVQIAVSPLPVSQVAAGLTYLLRYPYGCIEQTVSQCFPLLYFSEVAGEVAPDVFGEADAVYFVNSGIDRVVAMQLSGGGFSYWPGGTAAEANPWATVYATHFLVEAKRAGFVVPDRTMDAALSHLGAMTRSSRGPGLNRWNAAQKLRVRAYGVYVLALAGQPEKGTMEKMRLDDLERMPVDARYQLAGAYGLTGNKDVMRELLPVSVTQGPAKRQTGYTWHSRTRADAIMLEALATAEPVHSHVPVLLKQLLDRSENGRWHNTQENGWAFLALGKVLAAMGGTDIAGEVLVGGEIVGRFDAAGTIVEGSAAWAGKSVEIRAKGDGFGYYSIVDEGVPRGTEVRDVTDGLMVQRDFFTLDGGAIDPENIRQGDVVVARIELTSRSGRVQNIVVADLVPAGLEIENPRLMSRGAPGWARSGKALSIEYLDVRDDRLLLFTWADTQTRTFIYTLRAVTRGRFVLPPVKAEAMYDPSVVSIRGGGTLRVVAAQ